MLFHVRLQFFFLLFQDKDFDEHICVWGAVDEMIQMGLQNWCSTELVLAGFSAESNLIRTGAEMHVYFMHKSVNHAHVPAFQVCWKNTNA
jgi:hypothetical protein